MSLFVLLTGHNAAGKTTLAKRLEADLGFNVVSGDPLRYLMKKNISYFHDFDISITTEKGRGTAAIIHNYCKQVSQLLLSRNQPVIYDAGAIRKSYRKTILTEVTEGIDRPVVVILYVTLTEDELLGRLQARPEPHWVEHYKKNKKAFLEPPTADETDHVLMYDQVNYAEIRSELRALMG